MMRRLPASWIARPRKLSLTVLPDALERRGALRRPLRHGATIVRSIPMQDEDDHPLAPAKGVVIGVVLGSLLWAVIIVVIVRVLL